jgi:hypothetical protein
MFFAKFFGEIFLKITTSAPGYFQFSQLFWFQNLLRSTENCWENEFLSQIVVRSLSSNPDQLKPFCQKVLQPLWTPRPTETWMRLSQLLVDILEAIELRPLLTDASKRPNFSK